MTDTVVDIPTSLNTVSVKIIDTNCRIKCPLSHFVMPKVGNHTILEVPAFSFLIENPRNNHKLIFDLGVRKNFAETAPPPLANRILNSLKFEVEIEKDVAQVLEENGIDLKSINGIILSHAHWDHTGEAATFPTSTDLIVGPDFKKNFVPGYPTNKNGVMLDSDYRDRNVREIRFEATKTIGGFEAVDYFEDDSFYILNCPGHAIGHLCALARTTPDTFIFLGADTCHHGGQFRPSKQHPLPESIDFNVSGQIVPCPGAVFVGIHPEKTSTSPFYKVAVKKDGTSIAHDVVAANQSVVKMMSFDASDNILIILAHDKSLLDVIEFFPSSANNWKEKGWKTKGFWKFLQDFGIKLKKTF